MVTYSINIWKTNDHLSSLPWNITNTRHMTLEINALVCDMHRNVMGGGGRGVKPVNGIPTLLFCFLVSKGVTVLSSKLLIDRIQAYVHNHIKRYVTCLFIFEIKTLSISNIKKIHRQGFHIILFIGNRRTF